MKIEYITMMTENILNPHDARLEEVVLGACLAGKYRHSPRSG